MAISSGNSFSENSDGYSDKRYLARAADFHREATDRWIYYLVNNTGAEFPDQRFFQVTSNTTLISSPVAPLMVRDLRDERKRDIIALMIATRLFSAET